jgi:hypothetical protein
MAIATCTRDYSLYGLSLRSEIPLAFPETRSSAAPDITFSLKSPRFFSEARSLISSSLDEEWWYHHAALADGSVFVRVPGYCEFVVSSDGGSIACGELEESTAEWFQTYLLGVVLSFALLKQGHEPLHSTVVVVDGKGVALCGNSGWGKSTLAAAFLHAGHTILTDDLLIIRDVDGVLCGCPGPSRIKLFPHIARRFQPDKITHEPIDPGSEKLILPLAPHEVHDRPVPLHGFFVLDEPVDPTASVSIQTLPARLSFMAIVGAAFNVRERSPERLRRQFLAAKEWTARLPVRRLCYPRSLPMLDRVIEAVIADVRSADTVSV